MGTSTFRFLSATPQQARDPRGWRMTDDRDYTAEIERAPTIAEPEQVS